MANDLNQCNFIGRLGKDPETRSMPNGDQVANFSIACGWKTKTKEGTEWINIVAFGRLAEIIDQYLSKGSKVFISGNMRTRKWDDKDGVTKYTTEIVARELQFLDSKSSGKENNAAEMRSETRSASPYQSVPDNDFDDSDIPW
jgi:single-strand DNA-binding protein